MVRRRPSALVRAALWALLLAVLVLLVQSALWTPRLALPLRITVVAIGVTAALTPRVRWLVEPPSTLIVPLLFAVVAWLWPEDFCVEVRKFTRPELQRPLLSRLGQQPS